ncbi:hypothetical protein [Candidatus Accumulibacter sp. ACC012]|uniref:hypothetical protein n=1 Tax=Candidatus Accumulibacter sp. ACC012 TaxID=2823332 RepID=UPI0025BC0D44|nr:hypothetical protein [Candidatus Accumulibacter sp. ACC012]
MTSVKAILPLRSSGALRESCQGGGKYTRRQPRAVGKRRRRQRQGVAQAEIEALAG